MTEIGHAIKVQKGHRYVCYARKIRGKKTEAWIQEKRHLILSL